MKRTYIFILLIIFTCDVGCFIDFRSDKTINELIEQNKDKMLFLDFWADINEKDFKKVLVIENKKGNLSYGKFHLVNRYSEEVPFEVLYDDGGIKLNYFDHYYKYWNSNSILDNKTLAEFRGLFYWHIIHNLIETFDKKYVPKQALKEKKERYLSFSASYSYDYIWEAKMPNGKDKVVILKCYYSYYEGMPGEKFLVDDKKERNRLAVCWIKITYESLSKYLSIEERKKNWEDKKKIDSINRKNEEEKKIEKSWEKL